MKTTFHINAETGDITSYLWIDQCNPPPIIDSIAEFANRIETKETPPLKSIGIAMPIEFPSDRYESVSNQMEKYSKGPEDIVKIWKEFAAGWKAFAYRFFACREHCREFTKSIVKASRTPEPVERYLQDKELYGFYVNGISSVESYFYGIYMIGALKIPSEFLFNCKAIQSIKPAYVLKIIKKISFLKDQKFVKQGKKILRNKTYKQWNYIRNILVHRSAPGRNIYTTNDNVEWQINKIPIDNYTTITPYAWLASELTQLVTDTDDFLTSSVI